MISHYEELLAAERAKYPEVEDNWPNSVTLNSETFEVRYEIDAENEIVGFELIDGAGERLFGCEVSVIYLIEDHIWEIIYWEHDVAVPRFSAREASLYPEITAVVTGGKA